MKIGCLYRVGIMSVLRRWTRAVGFGSVKVWETDFDTKSGERAAARWRAARGYFWADNRDGSAMCRRCGKLGRCVIGLRKSENGYGKCSDRFGAS